MKQCTCGRSQTYPYCDGTHKIKKDAVYEQRKDNDNSNK